MTAFGIFELVLIIGWVLLFVVLFGYYFVLVFLRRGKGRQPRPPAPQWARRQGRAPAGLDALRRADPQFDEQLLLDAAQTATLLVFAAMSTGDDVPINRVVTAAFWRTPFGHIVQTVARDRRRENIEQEKNLASLGRRTQPWHIPLDYQASVPELAEVKVSAEQQVSVRVAFGQLQALVQPGAAALAAGAAATDVGSAALSLGLAVAARMSNDKRTEVSWVSSGGHYQLTFVRPGTATTSPTAALTDRTCRTCGATYRSELTTACEHCGADRPPPCGNWRLASAYPVI